MMPWLSYGPGIGILRSFETIVVILGLFTGVLADLTTIGFRGNIMLNAALIFVLIPVFALGAVEARPCK
jgi:hypothetical protein